MLMLAMVVRMMVLLPAVALLPVEGVRGARQALRCSLADECVQIACTEGLRGQREDMLGQLDGFGSKHNHRDPMLIAHAHLPMGEALLDPAGNPSPAGCGVEGSGAQY